MRLWKTARSRLRDSTLVTLLELLAIAAACVQHPRARRSIDGVRHTTPSGWLIASSLEGSMGGEPSLRITAEHSRKVSSSRTSLDSSLPGVFRRKSRACAVQETQARSSHAGLPLFPFTQSRFRPVRPGFLGFSSRWHDRVSRDDLSSGAPTS